MWTVALTLVVLGVFIQVPARSWSCDIHNLLADCSFRNLPRVPALPPNITILYLEFNFITEINRNSFRTLDQVEHIDLGNQFVPLVIKNDSFLRQNQLKRLVLGGIRGLHLEPRALAGLFRLTYLDLDHCGLTDSILAESVLQPLLSLETLDLSFNKIVRLQPGRFFSNLGKLKELELKLNRIDRLCEEDLVGFRGKNFTRFNLDSNRLNQMFEGNFSLDQCGNPFRAMAFGTLDVSGNRLNIEASTLFFKAIEGTQIQHLINSGTIGKGFSHNNFRDPDESTFEGLRNSSINNLDLSRNSIFALNTAVFRHFKDATIINVSKNQINQIRLGAFRGLQGTLRMLNLSFNLLGEIYSDTFTHLTELRVLDLSSNYVGVLGYEAFKGLPNLRLLDLKGNSLRTLGFPASVPSLQFLYLGDNKLESLHGIGRFSSTVQYLDVMDNKLKNMADVYVTIRDFRDLTQFFFGGNLIKWCEVGDGVSLPLNNSLLGLDLHDSYLQMVWAQGRCLDIFDQLNNLQGLNLSSNSLTSLPPGVFRGLLSIVLMDLSTNALTHLDSDVFPISLVVLDLSNNFLATPDPAAFHSLSFIDLVTNRFHCDCTLETFLTWLKNTNVSFMSPIEFYTCAFPASLQDLPVLNYSRTFEPCDMDDESTVQELRFPLFVLSALLVSILSLSGVFYARLRGHIFIIYKRVVGRVLDGPKPPADHMGYDAYLCFSNNDYRWVETALLKKLDKQFSEQNPLRCCFEARDFLPGEAHLANIRDAIWGSRKTVCIVSREFLKDGWCLEAFTLAQGRRVEELTEVLIMVVVDKVPRYQLSKHHCVRAFVHHSDYLTWPEDPQDLDRFYQRLVSLILKDTQVQKDQDGIHLKPIKGGG